MKWHIGGFTYRDELVEDLGANQEGQPILGQIDPEQRIIYVSKLAGRDRRLEVFLHEYRHAWEFHAPEPLSREDRCNHFATMTAALLLDLGRQGGVIRLLAGGEGRVGPHQPSVYSGTISPIEGRSIRCDQCGTSVAPASVAREPERSHPKLGVPVVWLSFWCDFCSHVQRWSELLGATGYPTGVQADPPTFITGAAAAEWCDAHPRESGVRHVNV